MDFLKRVPQLMKDAVKAQNQEQFSRVGWELVKLRNQAREALQELTAPEIKPLIHKLEKNQDLTPAEKDTVRLWIVGDAAAYAEMENDFKKWLAEFKRLTKVLEDYSSAAESTESLLDVHGVLEDAIRVCADLEHFLEARERLEKFEKAIDSLTEGDKKLLAQMLMAKLTSEEM